MLNEVFSDYFAQRKNFLTQVDARIKIIFVIASILTVISARAPYAGFAVIFLVMASLLSIRIPFKIIILRLSAPLGIALTILMVKIFFSFPGIGNGFLIVSKVMGSTSLILFLSMTTPLDKLLMAFRGFKIPGIWVEVCLIAYRYIFVLLEDVVRVFDAQRARLGYANWLVSMRSIGTLAGTVIIRAYDQSLATYEAMMLRGYKGKMLTFSLEERLKLKDLIAALIFVAILISLLTINRIFKL